MQYTHDEPCRYRSIDIRRILNLTAKEESVISPVICQEEVQLDIQRT